MANGVVYSANVFLKYHIQEKYLKFHYAWCSHDFDAQTVSRYSPGAMTPPSANPAQIIQQLKNDCRLHDKHSAKINEQRAILSSLAVKWHDDGKIGEDQREEILYKVQEADFEHWRPLLYVISTAPVMDRLRLVPISKRAGFGDEYVIEDLKSTEFDILEI